MSKLALVQKPPFFLDKYKTIQKAVDSIEEAAKNGVELVVFSEAFIPGYPTWIWRLRPGSDWDLSETLHMRLLNNAVVMESDDLAPMCAAVKKQI